MADEPRVGGLVLAGGSGSRFGPSPLPKQFQPLDDRRRLVDAAVETIAAVTDPVVLVLPAGRLPDGSPWDGAPVDAVAAAGSDRLGSVRAGLAALDRLDAACGRRCDVIVIHDAAHPLASVGSARAVIDAVLAGADAAVPWLPVVDVLKRRGPDGTLETAGRDGLGQAQTPHAFDGGRLRAIHAAPAGGAWEDTQLVEESGGRVVGVEGDPGNIHVVTPADLDLVRRLSGRRAPG